MNIRVTGTHPNCIVHLIPEVLADFYLLLQIEESAVKAGADVMTRGEKNPAPNHECFSVMLRLSESNEFLTNRRARRRDELTIDDVVNELGEGSLAGNQLAGLRAIIQRGIEARVNGRGSLQIADTFANLIGSDDPQYVGKCRDDLRAQIDALITEKLAEAKAAANDEPKPRSVFQRTHTHTFVKLGIPHAAFGFIADKLKEAGYDHAFVNDALIDMAGIAVEPDTAASFRVMTPAPENGNKRTARCPESIFNVLMAVAKEHVVEMIVSDTALDFEGMALSDDSTWPAGTHRYDPASMSIRVPTQFMLYFEQELYRSVGRKIDAKTGLLDMSGFVIHKA